jgi:coproporphyrinogen III oxidase
MDSISSQRQPFEAFIHSLQDTICERLAQIDGGKSFREDQWERDGGGGGRTRVLEKGDVIEKGGVNVSVVYGELSDALKHQLKTEGTDFYACGLSLVIHPSNPHAPTAHANIRYFEVLDNESVTKAWFGGGMDLTPYYLYEEDARHFHAEIKETCDKHDSKFYPEFKQECDTYFWNDHRNEARGVGGVFFDYQKQDESRTLEEIRAFTEDIGSSFIPAYAPILEKRATSDFTENQRYWQELRRGRYVEFNLIHDRGTLFGLKSNGRIESILMSLPPEVRWDYDAHPQEGTDEAKLLDVLKHPVDWV